MSRLRCICGASSDDEKGRHWEDQPAQEEKSVDRLVAVADALPQVEARHQRLPLDRCRFGHFSGTLIPSKPVGRSTSTPIRMPKITTSVHLEPMYESL